MPIFLGFPSKREVPAEVVHRQYAWLLGEPQGVPKARAPSIGNLIHVNRSRLIQSAKEAQQKHAELWHVQLDTDAYPVTPLLDCLRFVGQDFKAGFGLVIAPVHNLATDEGGTHVIVKDWTNAPDAKEVAGTAWEVSGGSFSMVWFNPGLLKELKPFGEFKPVNMNSPIPLYCQPEGNATEDHNLIRRAGLIGWPTCVDSRLIVEHYKEHKVPGYGFLDDEKPAGQSVLERRLNEVREERLSQLRQEP